MSTDNPPRIAMHDQAKELRQLVRNRMAESGASNRPRTLVVSGAKGGVGTTTIAMNLAVAFAMRQDRTVLVDADPDAGDIALLCRLDDHPNIADVFSGKQTVENILREGPGGIRVVPGAWGLDFSADCSSMAQDRFLSQLRAMGADVDLIVLDSGGQTSRMVRRFWQAADAVLLVTSPELTSVMDAYATIKILAGTDPSMRIHLAINLVGEKDDSAEVHARLQKACQRFLGIPLHGATRIAKNASVSASARNGSLLMLEKPEGMAARHLGELADHLTEILELNRSEKRRFPKPKIIHSIDKIDSTRTCPIADDREHCESVVAAKM